MADLLQSSKLDQFALLGPSTAAQVVSKLDVYALTGPSTFALNQVIQLGCTQMVVVGIISNTQIIVDIIGDPLATIPNDPSNTPLPILKGAWTLAVPTQTVTGLQHLAGKQVTGVADGLVVGPLTVSASGSVTLPRPAASVILGLGYTSQLETLYLDTPGPGGATIQGDRKAIPAVTFRLECTQGIYAGPDFADLSPVKDCAADSPMPGSFTPFFTGDTYVTIAGFADDTSGQFCIQQSLPLPMSVLGTMPKVEFGDTQR